MLACGGLRTGHLYVITALAWYIGQVIGKEARVVLLAIERG